MRLRDLGYYLVLGAILLTAVAALATLAVLAMIGRWAG